jgi:hypothetical protein
MKKLYARMLEARCPMGEADLDRMVPVLQDEIVAYARREPGCRQIHFFADRDSGRVFSITIFETAEDLERAMAISDSEFRFRTLAGLGCTAVAATALDVIAGAGEPPG